MKAEEIERRFSHGECIVERGSQDPELYVVHSGNVLVHCENPSVEYVLGAGEIFGELGALLSRPSPYRIVAESDASVLVLPPELLERLCRECPEFNVRLLLCLAERSARASAALPEPDEISPSDRAIASAILARTVWGEGPAPMKGKLRDLAESAELDIRTAYHSLQRLLDRRLVGLVDDQLTVLEGEDLEAIARG